MSTLDPMPLSFTELGQDTYEKQIEMMRLLADEGKEKLLNTDIEKVKKELGIRNPMLLMAIHEHLMFARSEEVMKKLSEFRLPQRVMNWFISLNDIIKHMDDIESKGIEINRRQILFAVNSHFKIKFIYNIQFWSYLVKDKGDMFVTGGTEFLKDMLRRQDQNDPSKLTSTKCDHEPGYLEKITLAKSLSNNTFNENTFLAISRGKTEKSIVRSMIRDYFSYDKKTMSETKFLALLYNFFRLIMPDKKMEDYDNSSNIKFDKDRYAVDKAIKLKHLILRN